jgi:hypothetical protein
MKFSIIALIVGTPAVASALPQPQTDAAPQPQEGDVEAAGLSSHSWKKLAPQEEKTKGDVEAVGFPTYSWKE